MPSECFRNYENAAPGSQDGLHVRPGRGPRGERCIEPGKLCGRSRAVTLRHGRQHRAEIGI